MSETQSARWVGLALGAVLTIILALNAISRTEASDTADAADKTAASSPVTTGSVQK
jgi:hypothetical protein